MINIVELFGGIGAPRLALKYLNVPTEVVGYVEIDKFAVKGYNAIHGDNQEPIDITKYYTHSEFNGEVDIMISGSPCQDFSTAGFNAGGGRDSGTRSSLLWHTVRLSKVMEPKFVVFENVASVLNKRHIEVFNEFLSAMEDIGYLHTYKVISPTDFDVPHSRSRVFVVFYKENLQLGDYKWTEPVELKTELQDLLEADPEERYYLSNLAIERNTRNGIKDESYDNKVSKCLISNYSKLGKNNQYVTTNGKKRALTPREAARLMSIKDEDFDKLAQALSVSRQYMAVGNSINVEVMKQVLKPIVDMLGVG